jgi:hypothetical protein
MHSTILIILICIAFASYAVGKIAEIIVENRKKKNDN